MTSSVPGGFIRTVAAAAAFFAVVGATSIASAVSFSGSYQINAHNSGDGLLIQTQELADPLNFVLTNPGTMDAIYKVDLFKIWTDETDVGPDDLIQSMISVDFNFGAPSSGGSVTGATFGGTASFLFLQWEGGVVVWDGPSVIDFGNLGRLQVELSDEKFNWGFYGTKPGWKKGAKVEAKFTLLNDAVAVPLPASLPLFMAALGGLALLRRRASAAA